MKREGMVEDKRNRGCMRYQILGNIQVEGSYALRRIEGDRTMDNRCHIKDLTMGRTPKKIMFICCKSLESCASAE